MQSTSDNAVNNADVEGVLTSVGVQREDIIGGRYDFAKLHVFLWDYESNTLVKKLGSGHWGEVTIKDGSYVAEFRSLSQQLQQTIGRTYNPECDEQLGETRCQIGLGLFPKEDGLISADTSKTTFTDSTKIDADDFYNGMVLTWTNGSNNASSSTILSFSSGIFILDVGMQNYINFGDTYEIDFNTYNGSVTEYGASLDTIVDDSLTATDFIGMYVEFTSGLNEGDFRQIIAQDTIVDTMTLDSNLDNPILNSDEYIVINMTSNTYMELGRVTEVTDNGVFKASLTGVLVGTPLYGDDYFNYGKLTFKSGLNDELYIEVKDFDVATGEFTLFLPMPFQIAEEDIFQVFAGCDKRLTTCKDKFDNVINFQGFPYIPGVDQISLFGGQ